MLYALNANNNKVLASPKVVASCPQCLQQVIPKCGQIKVWHWAHKRSDCDSWHEPESEWHLSWKRLVDPERTEVVMGSHRADIVGNQDTVIELQNSPISVAEIAEREKFYDLMVWVFNGESFANRLRVRRDYGRPWYKLLDVLLVESIRKKTVEELRRQLLSQTENQEREGKFVVSCNEREFRLLKQVYLSKGRYSVETAIGKFHFVGYYCDRINWSYIRESHRSIRKPLFYDLGSDLMLLVKEFKWGELSGWVINKEWFKSVFLS